MPDILYQSTRFEKASAQEAIRTTSSQIFLSRGVADSDPDPARQSDPPPSVASTFESSSKHIFSLADAPHPRSPFFLSTDGGLASPDGIDQRHYPNRSPTASCQSVEKSEDRASTNRSITSKYKVIDKDKGKNVERGRTRERVPRYPNPLADAESRRRNTMIELDGCPILKRPSRSSTFFEDPSDPCAILDDKLLEPCPHILTCSSFSEVLNSPARPRATTASYARFVGTAPVKPTRAPTTVFSNCPPHSPAPIPTHSAKLSALQQEAESESFNLNQGTGPEPPTSLAAGLPTEVIHQIFYSLHPTDFNAARHTCRAWLVTSLERSILETMLRRGGWSSGISRNVRSSARDTSHEQDNVNEEWQLGKRLSRECALGPDWTGNGLGNKSPKLAFVHTSATDFTDIAVHYPGLNSSGTVFTVSCCGKFLMAANGCLIYIYELNKTYSNDSILSDPGSLRPVTSILCPRTVLACSMDTSSHRYAIAILLDGRMGLVCEINPANISASSHFSNWSECSDFSKTTKSEFTTSETERNRCGAAFFPDPVSLNSFSSNPSSARPSSEPPFVSPGIAAATPPLSVARTSDESCWQDVYNSDSPKAVQTEVPSSRHASLPREHIPSPRSRTQCIRPPHIDGEPSGRAMPIESGPRSLYRNLCSDDDPPRSVAICPQRRCVAFGCSAGIELHWVDALTGQDLNRWFPLSAPSDYLFFLPPRKSVDTAKKLRLISSAARPGERAAISDRAFGGRTKNSPFWERLGWGAGIVDDEEIASQTQGMLSRLRNEGRARGLSSRMDCSDHYRAIPISDGYHILFTDPSTGLLCLGSDAPVGGPTKLLRKIWFQGPEGERSPVSYAGGSDLNFGVRVVAAFGKGAEQRILFFSVPGDVFGANTQSCPTMVKDSWLKSGANCSPNSLEWMNWWPDDGLHEWLNHTQDPVPGIFPRSVWPVKIKGQEIGTLPGLVDLAIDSGPHMTIWAFSSNGVAKVWQIEDGTFGGSVTERLVARDGTIRELDGEGDVEMMDAPSSYSFSSSNILVAPPSLNFDLPDAEMSNAPSSPASSDTLASPLSHRPETFDGTASFTLPSSTMFFTKFEQHSRIHRNLRPLNCDADADILMDDLQDSETEEHMLQGSLDEVALARAGNFVYETFHRSESIHTGRGTDVFEDLTGIARIDIEIY